LRREGVPPSIPRINSFKYLPPSFPLPRPLRNRPCRLPSLPPVSAEAACNNADALQAPGLNATLRHPLCGRGKQKSRGATRTPSAGRGTRGERRASRSRSVASEAERVYADRATVEGDRRAIGGRKVEGRIGQTRSCGETANRREAEASLAGPDRIAGDSTRRTSWSFTTLRGKFASRISAPSERRRPPLLSRDLLGDTLWLPSLRARSDDKDVHGVARNGFLRG